MGNEIINPSADKPAAPQEIRSIKMESGSKYFEKVDTVKQELNITVLNLPDAVRQQIPLWSRECYNLFVIEGTDFQRSPQGRFDIIGEAILPAGYTSDNIRENYLPLTTDIKSDISAYPCIFANRNHNEGKPGKRQMAVFGYITEIRESRGKVVIQYQAVKTISQQGLLAVMDVMGIRKASYANEYDVEHWAIKEIDLLSVLPELEVL